LRRVGRVRPRYISDIEQIHDDSIRLSKQADLIIELSKLGLLVGHKISPKKYRYKQRLLEHLKVERPPDSDLWARKMIALRKHLCAQLTSTLSTACEDLKAWEDDIKNMRKFYKNRRVKIHEIDGFEIFIEQLISDAAEFIEEIEKNKFTFRASSGRFDIRLAASDFTQFLQDYYDLDQNLEQFYSLYADERNIKIDRRQAILTNVGKVAIKGVLAVFTSGAAAI